MQFAVIKKLYIGVRGIKRLYGEITKGVR